MYMTDQDIADLGRLANYASHHLRTPKFQMAERTISEFVDQTKN
jgi:hypothetical protein